MQNEIDNFNFEISIMQTLLCKFVVKIIGWHKSKYECLAYQGAHSTNLQQQQFKYYWKLLRAQMHCERSRSEEKCSLRVCESN